MPETSWCTYYDLTGVPIVKGPTSWLRGAGCCLFIPLVEKLESPENKPDDIMECSIMMCSAAYMDMLNDPI
jgi:hypothetical protein